MNVLFLTDSRHSLVPFQDGSTRYRCYHMAEALRSLGHRADVTTLAGYDKRTLARYDVVSVLRPASSRRLLRLADHCRRLRVVLTADIDDLVFMPVVAESSPAVINGQMPVERVRRRYVRHSRALTLFDRISVSTQPLAQILRKRCPTIKVAVIPNGLSQQWLARTGMDAPGRHRPPRVSYFAGTRSHQKDFESVLGPLAAFFRQSTASELMLVGELDSPRMLLAPERLSRLASVPYAELPPLIASSRVTLAPLQDTPFNRAKSHVKFIEAAAMGTPVVCSPIPDMRRHEVDGLLFARTDTDWLSALEQLFCGDRARRCGRGLRDYVLDCCLARHGVADLIDLWSGAVTAHPVSTTRSASLG